MNEARWRSTVRLGLIAGLVVASLASCQPKSSGSTTGDGASNLLVRRISAEQEAGLLSSGISRSATLRALAPPPKPDQQPTTSRSIRPKPRPRPRVGPSPGRLIAQSPLRGTGLRGRVSRIVYHSRTTRDIDVAVTGLVMLPEGTPPAGGWPVVAYGHPTTGSADACAPSADPTKSPVDVWNTMLANHIAIAAPDYEGLGGPGRHPYLVGPSEARSMIDAVRAARQLSAGRLSTRYVAWGLSQGGHAAVFTGAATARYAPELRLVGVVAVAPVSDLKVFFTAGGLAVPDVFALLLGSGYSAAYPQADPSLFLRHAAVVRLPFVDASCTFGRAFAGIAGGVKWRRPADSLVWRKLLEANSLGAQRLKTPILVVQGLADGVIPADQTFRLVARLCDSGDVVNARFYAGLNHGTVLAGAMGTYIPWIASRFSGRSVASQCPPAAGGGAPTARR